MKVMIVDDNHMLQTRLTNALINIDSSINIQQVSNCKEALDLFSPFSPDKIVLDISLPDGSGINLLREFKNSNPSTEVIMFTNFPTDEFKKRCLELGADHFFDKSKLNELIKILK